MEESILKPKKYYANNYLISKKFIKCCKESGINRFIFSSTAAVYGNLNKNVKVQEKSQLKPISMYGVTKKKVEEYLNKISDNNFNFFSLRYFNVIGGDRLLKYGPIGLNNKSLTNNLFKALEKKKDFKIFGVNHQTKDGTPVRDFIHVDDLASIHYKALEYLTKFKKNQICNCGYGKGYSIKEIAEIFKKKNSKNFNYSFTNKRLGDISYMVADVKKINKLLNWKPKFSSLEKMLTSEIKWKIKIKK